MKFNSSEKYDQFYDDYRFQDQNDSLDDNFFCINEKNENESASFPLIKEYFHYSSDMIEDKKNSKPKSFIFESHCFFNPKLKETEQIINKKNKKRKMYSLSRKAHRKEMKDNIIKKIKSRFFKSIKKILKEKLIIKYKYKKSFKYLPQAFICDIKKENNKSFWEETLLEFLEGRLERDNKVLNLIKEDRVGEIKLKDLFNDYLNSQEFKESIPNFDNERYIDQNYINDYINNAKEFIDYFTKEKKLKN